jgi:ABC-type sugar transport system ATPase subunit
MTTVTLQHIHKAFASEADARAGETGRPGLHDIHLKAMSGEIVALLGPSGSGKSTLLRIIAGLATPDSGDVLYDGVPLRSIPLAERGIGMVFQEHALMPHWKARKSVGFFLSLRDRDREFSPRMARIAAITGFNTETLLDRRPHALSGGEQQRVSIARLLMRDPRVFLFDEPFAHLDAPLRQHARIELRRLLSAYPVTGFYVTHDQAEAVGLATRIAVLRDGRIEQAGPYADLYAQPVNLFVAGFIGTPPMNVLAGRVRDGTWAAADGSGGLPVRRDLPDGAAVHVGVRAEHMRIVPAQAGETAAFPLKATVSRVVAAYSERRAWVYAESDGGPLIAFAPLDLAVGAGDRITIALDPAHALFFDPKSERRIG